MSKSLFNRESIYVLDGVSNKEELINKICSDLQSQGYINEGYREALIERELEFPTGIETKQCSFAIPHVDSENVNKTTVAFVKLVNPVLWESMEDPSESLEVNFVFFIVLTSDEKHMTTLASIIHIVQDEEIVENLLAAQDVDDILSILERRS